MEIGVIAVRIRILLIILITFVTIGGCGGDGSIFSTNGEVRCKKALDDKDAFCSRGVNPGMCCHVVPCAFLSLTNCTVCMSSLGPCCNKEEVLCPTADICLENQNQCPDSDEPLVSEFITFEVLELGCPRAISLRGVVYGPHGTELKVSSAEIPQSEIDSFISLDCRSWTNIDGRCVRTVSDPAATGFNLFIDIFYFFLRPSPEVDFIISTQDDSRIVTQPACPPI